MKTSPKLQSLNETLERLLMAGETINFRSVVREMPSIFKHVTDITRNVERRELVETYKARQAMVRATAEKIDKNSKSNLINRCANLEHKVAELERQRDLLVASHKAMILAVGEMGGIAAWRRFFPGYKNSLISDLDMTLTETR